MSSDAQVTFLTQEAHDRLTAELEHLSTTGREEIAKRIEAEIAPQWLRIGGYWYPRGGIPIDVYYHSGAAPKDAWIPDQAVQAYRGRG